MPRKKATSTEPATAAANETATKAKTNSKTLKRGAQTPDAPEVKKRTRAVKKPEKIEEVPEVKKRGKAAKKPQKEVPELDVPEVKKRAKKQPAGKKEKAQEIDIESEVPEKKKRTRKAVDSKDENGTVKEKKVTKTKKELEKVKDDENDDEADLLTPAAPKGRGKRAAASAKEAKDKPEPKPAKNAVNTDWDGLNFSCSSKNPKGKSSNFNIMSWNVDGLRAWLKKGGLEIVQRAKPDILCLQETKCSLDKLPEEVKTLEGYTTYWCSSDKDGYAGVGVVTNVKPIDVKYGIGSEEHDAEGRCITLELDTFFIVNVYVPNAGRKLVTLPKRLDWNELFKVYVKNLEEKKPVIICGDMNVAHHEIDLANPKANKKNAGFTQEERDGMTDFLGDGYVDTFRQLYPNKEKAYTFWTYLANSRSKNVGWRLDYFLVSSQFMDRVCDTVIHSDVLGSDHCPISLYVNI